VFRVNFRRIDVASFQGRQGEEETLPEQILFTGGTVLVVDDIVTNREVITEFLQGMNLQLLQAGNGREALQVVGRHRPDLILLDIQMPVMDGWEFARIIKEDPDTREIPVVVLSATVAMNYRERLRELGLQGFLGKPIRRMRLVEEIKRFLPWRLLNEYLREAMDDEQDTEETLSNNVPDHPPETNPAQPLDQRKARELMELLRGRLRREREEIQETSEMSRIEAFAGEMRRLASEHGLQSLAKYAEDLNSAVDSFDISGITHLLEQYPALLDNLEEELPG
jgi:two-component system sensor histidine kinase EvgS